MDSYGDHTQNFDIYGLLTHPTQGGRRSRKQKRREAAKQREGKSKKTVEKNSKTRKSRPPSFINTTPHTHTGATTVQVTHVIANVASWHWLLKCWPQA